MEKKKNTVDMLNGSLADKIILFALPLAASSILQQLFNSADLAVVGRFASSEAMAAVGSNAPVINLIVSLFTGLSVGANVLIATLIGKNQKEKINEAVHTIFSVSVLSGIVLIFLGIIGSREILKLMDAPDSVMNAAILYLRIYFTGMPFVMIYNFGSAILRARGDSARPLLCLVVSGIVNVILNLFFVIVCHMSVDGVAYATVISNLIGACFIIRFLMSEEETFRLSFRKLHIHKEFLIEIVKIGLPAGIQGMVFSLSNVVIQSAINSFGADAIAGASAGQNFEFMAYFIVNAFAQAAVTFTSQNFGAGKFDRCKKVYRITMTCSTIMTAILSAVFWIGRYQFLSLFTTSSAVVSYALIRMFWVANLEIGTGLYEIAGGCLRGMGKSMLPAVLTLIGSCLFRLVYITTIFKAIRSFDTLFMVYPISWVITGTAVIIAYFHIRKQLFAENTEAQNA